MAYKPPKQSIIDNDLKGVPSNEAVFEGLKLKLPKPSVDGTSGQLLSRGATADDTSWVNPPASLPSQTGNLDKVLVTDGSSASWQYTGLGSGSFGAGNTVVGRNKPISLTGVENSLLGSAVGDSLSTGFRNVLLGVYAGGGITSGQGNIAIGYGTGYTSGYALLDTGIRNVLIGLSASTAATNTNESVAIGYSAVSALNGVSMGSESARYMTGSNNVALGYQAMLGSSGSSSGARNVAVGYQAGLGITSGNNNVMVGTSAGTTMTTSSDSVAVGYNVNANNAPNSVSIGSGSSAPNSQGESVAIGYNAAGGWYSVVIGSNSSTWTGNNGGQVVVGSSSTAATFGTTIGGFASSSAASVAIGRSAAANGNYSIAIGFDANADSIANAMAIGSDSAYIEKVYIGKGAAGQTTANAVRIQTQKAVGTNIDLSAGTLTLAGSQSTGNKNGGSVFIATAPAGSSGTALNSHVNRLETTATGDVKVLTGDLTIDTAGKGLAIKSGTDAKIGTAQFTAQQTVTVNTTAITANSLVFLTGQDGVNSYAVQNKVAGASFEIHHVGGNTTSLVAWMIVEATP